MRTAMMRAEQYAEHAEQKAEQDGPTDPGAQMGVALSIAWGLIALAKAYRGDVEEGDHQE